ncbi:MAG: hypothetical protein QN183_10935 [Armatimonadota bacterium]|nr:hypothetical protein [Armatimonadota bacterium]MDR7486952.1 hypothetical protein [Armatimonadota bacterium]MDR7533543.1 hypothetical protein [Armatimonadota bacterium]MDR7536867.1 hypothetical protein [Armatimonadota bacterium]
MLRRVAELVGQVTGDSRKEWLVVASVLVLLALAVALGWIRLELPRAP